MPVVRKLSYLDKKLTICNTVVYKVQRQHMTTPRQMLECGKITILVFLKSSAGCQIRVLFRTKHALTMHTVSFDWFLSGLELILNLEFCFLKLFIFYQKLLWNIRSRLNSSTFWVFEPVFTYYWFTIFIFYAKSFNFDQTYMIQA